MYYLITKQTNKQTTKQKKITKKQEQETKLRRSVEGEYPAVGKRVKEDIAGTELLDL